MASALPELRAVHCPGAAWKQQGPGWLLSRWAESRKSSYPMTSGLSNPQHTFSAQHRLGIFRQKNISVCWTVCLCQVENQSNTGDLGSVHSGEKVSHISFLTVSTGCLTEFVSECSLCRDLDYSISLFSGTKFTGVHFPKARTVLFWLDPDVQQWSCLLDRELDAQGRIRILSPIPLVAALNMKKQFEMAEMKCFS